MADETTAKDATNGTMANGMWIIGTSVHPVDQLLLTAIRQSGKNSIINQPRWAHVRDMLCVGSTSARRMREMAGVDPEQNIGLRARRP